MRTRKAVWGEWGEAPVSRQRCRSTILPHNNPGEQARAMLANAGLAVGWAASRDANCQTILQHRLKATSKYWTST